VLDNAGTWARTRCHIEARAIGTRATITIDDDGPGMPMELRGRVPARGVRADEASPGSGLGLSISHALVQAYGGQLSLHDSPLGGLRVEIELPAG
jgi:signal transduction histidine kinase